MARYWHYALQLSLALLLVSSSGCNEEEPATPAAKVQNGAKTEVIPTSTTFKSSPTADSKSTGPKELTAEEIDAKLANRKSRFEAPFKRVGGLFQAPEVPQGIVATPIKVEKGPDKKPTAEAKLRLLGFVELENEDRKAIVEFKGEVHTLHEGDYLEDAKVISIENNEISLQRGSERINTKLFEQAWAHQSATSSGNYASSSSKSRNSFKPSTRPTNSQVVASSQTTRANPNSAPAAMPVPGLMDVSPAAMAAPAGMASMPGMGAMPGGMSMDPTAMMGGMSMPGGMSGGMSMPGGSMGGMPGGMAGPPN
jgi:Tfp pilus assembly protein PilP